MRPLTVLIGILMGSAASITFGLGTVLIVLMVLAGRHPDMLEEFKLPQLLLSLLAFGGLTAPVPVVSSARPKGGRGASGRMSQLSSASRVWS
jgi:hypothetical protein